MLNIHHFEADIEEIARSAFPSTAEAVDFLSRHGVFLMRDSGQSRRFLCISHTSPDPKDGRRWTILKLISVAKTISFDEETGMPVYASKILCDSDLTSLSDTLEGALTKFATKVMLRYGG